MKDRDKSKDAERERERDAEKDAEGDVVCDSGSVSGGSPGKIIKKNRHPLIMIINMTMKTHVNPLASSMPSGCCLFDAREKNDKQNLEKS